MLESSIDLESNDSDQMQNGIESVDVVRFDTGTLNGNSSRRDDMQGQAINVELMFSPGSAAACLDNSNAAVNTAFVQQRDSDLTTKSVKVEHVDEWALHRILRQAI